MAKDLCIYCGIEEAKVQWRQAGLARLKDRKGKGRATDRQARELLNIPERIEGRRRLAIQLRLNWLPVEMHEGELSYAPISMDAEFGDAGNINMQLSYTQMELFEEEIFAEVIREARESSYEISATRDAITISSSEAFSLTLRMMSIDDLPAVGQSPSSHPAILAQLVSALFRLSMIEIYKVRRKDLTAEGPGPGPSPSPGPGPGSAPPRTQPHILPPLMGLLTYFVHVSSVKQILRSVLAAFSDLDIFSDNNTPDQGDLSLDFIYSLDSSLDIIAAWQPGSGQLRLGGCATLSLGSRSIDLTFSPPKNMTLHLPNKHLNLSSSNEQLILVLQQAVRAALLDKLTAVLESSVHSAGSWEVLPTPKVISADTRALARRRNGKDIVEFV